MKKNTSINILSFLFFTLIFFSCSTPVYISNWQDRDFKKIKDYELREPFRFYDSKSHLQYLISNDNKNIYLCVKATDEQIQFKILRAGMQISLDTLGKKNKPATIFFPLGTKNNSEDLNTEKSSWKNADIAYIKKQFLSEYQELNLSGFKYPVGKLLPLHNEFGIDISIKWDSTNIMYYKAIIPFKTFYKDSISISDTSKIMNFTFIVNSLNLHQGKDHKNTQENDMNDRSTGMNITGNGQGINGMNESRRQQPGGRFNNFDDKSAASESNTFSLRMKLTVR